MLARCAHLRIGGILPPDGGRMPPILWLGPKAALGKDRSAPSMTAKGIARAGKSSPPQA
jgi:hypothetical protein